MAMNWGTSLTNLQSVGHTRRGGTGPPMSRKAPQEYCVRPHERGLQNQQLPTQALGVYGLEFRVEARRKYFASGFQGLGASGLGISTLNCRPDSYSCTLNLEKNVSM